MIDNFMIFIPFGLLLGVNLKKITFWHKLAIICISSFAVETLQFIFAIGITDITDVITNTLGGLAGLLMYDLGKKYVNNKRLDQFITILSAILIAAFLLLRIFVLKVKY
jgi:glycopeptide antibiotics resistance protein